MKRRKNLILLLPFLLMSIFSCQKNTKPQPAEGVTILRNYCTEIGRFDLIFYEDEVSGAYSLLPKKSLGAVWGKLENRQMIGRWMDEDGQGDITIEFNQDFSWFTTSYRNDELPEKWYKDQWHGQLKPNNNSKFETNGKKYMCE